MLQVVKLQRRVNIDRGQTFLAESSNNRIFFFKKVTWKRRITDITFSLHKRHPLYIISIFADTGY